MQNEQKINYQKILDKTLLDLESQNKKPHLLLHACCAPCSSYVLEYLASRFKITILYYNPNIAPEAEYNRRLLELKNFLKGFPPALRNNVRLVEEAYNAEEFYEAVNTREEKNLQTEKERGERCKRCYNLRMKRAFLYAKENEFDYFTTTLSISPHKDSKMINEIGIFLQNQNENTPPLFLISDFKKKGGYARSLELSREYNLYRQDYCGCIYSKQNTQKERQEKLINQP